MQFGYIIDFASAFVMLRIYWPSMELLFRTKPFAVGVENSDQLMLERSRNAEAR